MKREYEFAGADYVPERDHDRLATQIGRIFVVMVDEEWRTLDQISRLCNAPHASVSAQLRNLRKPKFGGHTVNRRHLADGLYEYQLEGAEVTFHQIP